MHFLLIETSTERGVIAYMQDQTILFARDLPFGSSQSKFLMPYLEEALRPFGFPPLLDAIGVGIGPGSYTGIRLGVAVAQALAYSWQVPLVGVPSVHGFVPLQPHVSFAAILDARISGVYLQKGKHLEAGQYQRGLPFICPLAEVSKELEGITHLISPSTASLKSKLASQDPQALWQWYEQAPSVLALAQSVLQLYEEGKKVYPPATLDLLYLRQTEAEREKARKCLSI